MLKHEQREISKYGMKGNNWMMSKSISSGKNFFIDLHNMHLSLGDIVQTLLI